MTIATYNRECLLGEIVDGELRLNDFGRAVEHAWLNTPNIRSQVELDEYVVMPNHFHAILMIVDHSRGVLRYAPTFRSPSHTVGAIVRGFKSAVTQRINDWRGTPGAPLWQRNYYEHVIRTDDELRRIRQYILDNPAHWMMDQENPVTFSRGL